MVKETVPLGPQNSWPLRLLFICRDPGSLSCGVFLIFGQTQLFPFGSPSPSPLFVLFVCVLVPYSCPALCDPMECSRSPGFSVHGILQARILEWVAIPFPRGSSQPRHGTWVSHTADRFFTFWATREIHSLLEKCESKLQWGITLLWSEWLLSKNVQTINAGKDMENRESFCTVGGNANWYSHYGEQYGESLRN